MGIPLATTTITVRRPTVTGDGYDTGPTVAIVASGVRAHISTPSGREQQRGGAQEAIDFRLDCDTVDLRHVDQVLDEQTSLVFEVVWAYPRAGLGIDHIEAGLRRAGAAV